MKQVDHIFKQKNLHKREDLISLLSLMQSVITEIRIKIFSEQVEIQLDQLDKHLFYAQSKHTHTAARDAYQELLVKLERKHSS